MDRDGTTMWETKPRTTAQKIYQTVNVTGRCHET